MAAPSGFYFCWQGIVKGVEKERKKFFFEKKNQKTFPGLVCAAGGRPGSNG
jgi:hypothetical protein